MGKNFRVSFQIKHPKEDLELAAKKMGIDPFRIWRAGSQRETPKGTTLVGKYDYSYCCLRPQSIEDLCGSDLITGFLEELEKHSKYWADLSSSGGTLSLIIFNEKDKRSYTDVFDWQLLDRLSKLKISLGFEL